MRSDWLAGLAEELLALDRPLILVTSGAVALGRARLAAGRSLPQAQAAAAVGQIALAQAWDQALDHRAAQLLLSLDDLEDRRRYLNARDTLHTLLAHGLIPVVNENDSVATEELRFGDNDRLSARVAQAAGADGLVLLSDVDGLMTADPRSDPDARLIETVETVDAAVLARAGPAAPQGVGTGGMISKLQAAQIATAAGVAVLLISGKAARPLTRFADSGIGTRFAAPATPLAVRKAWLAGLQRPQGTVRIDAGAARALAQRGGSLLAAGVTAVTGTLRRGDLVRIEDPSEALIGQGLIGYDGSEAARILGRSSEEIADILGPAARGPLIHRDDLVLFDQGYDHGR